MPNDVQRLLENVSSKWTKLGETFLVFGRLDTNKKCCPPLKCTQSSLIPHYDALQDLVIVVEYFATIMHWHQSIAIFANEQHQQGH